MLISHLKFFIGNLETLVCARATRALKESMHSMFWDVQAFNSVRFTIQHAKAHAPRMLSLGVTKDRLGVPLGISASDIELLRVPLTTLGYRSPLAFAR